MIIIGAIALIIYAAILLCIFLDAREAHTGNYGQIVTAKQNDDGSEEIIEVVTQNVVLINEMTVEYSKY